MIKEILEQRSRLLDQRYQDRVQQRIAKIDDVRNRLFELNNQIQSGGIDLTNNLNLQSDAYGEYLDLRAQTLQLSVQDHINATLIPITGRFPQLTPLTNLFIRSK